MKSSIGSFVGDDVCHRAVEGQVRLSKDVGRRLRRLSRGGRSGRGVDGECGHPRWWCDGVGDAVERQRAAGGKGEAEGVGCGSGWGYAGGRRIFWMLTGSGRVAGIGRLGGLWNGCGESPVDLQENESCMCWELFVDNRTNSLHLKIYIDVQCVGW